MQGHLQLYVGTGKGKTTAALGLCLRAAGAGLRIYFGQFLKPPRSSEVRTLQERFSDQIAYEALGPFRFIPKAPTPQEKQTAREGLRRIEAVLSSGKYDLVVGDEALTAVSAGLFSETDLTLLAAARPSDVELVLTGREAGPALVEMADLVTEMRAVKHYFDRGVKARPGIEY